MPVKEPKRKLTRAERAAINRENGRKGGFAKGGHRSVIALQKDLIKTHIDQRLMRATDVFLNAHISLARGVQFLYRIDKTFVRSGGKNKETGEANGYWRNEKPALVTAQWEIEKYLEELAENNGDISDDKDEGAAYYFITTKEPNQQAIDSGMNRVHGRPKETIAHEGEIVFSLVQLAAQRKSEMLDANADTKVLEEPDVLLNAPDA